MHERQSAQHPTALLMAKCRFCAFFICVPNLPITIWPIEEQAKIAARLKMESEPLTKLLEENAYRETIWRQRVNEAATANMLALAKCTDFETWQPITTSSAWSTRRPSSPPCHRFRCIWKV